MARRISRTRRRVCARQRRCRCREQGFTLLELMFTLGVFMIALLGLVAMQMNVMTAGRRAIDASMATNIATSTLERLQVQTFDSITGQHIEIYDRYGVRIVDPEGEADDPEVVESTLPRYFTATWTATPADALSTFVTVNVRWRMRIASDTAPVRRYEEWGDQPGNAIGITMSTRIRKR